MFERSLFVFAALFALNAIAAGKGSDEVDPTLWKPIHEQVYAGATDPKLEPEQTLELLKKLQQIYADFSDSTTNGRKGKIEKLVEVSAFDASKCDERSFQRIADLMVMNSMFTRNLMPYLYQQRTRHATECKSVIGGQFEEVRGRVSLEVEQNMIMVREFIDQAEDALNDKLAAKPRLTDPSNYIAQGLLNYLSFKDPERVDQLSKKRSSQRRSELESLLGKHLIPICKTLAHEMAPFEYIYTSGLASQMGDELQHWLKYTRNCEIIVHQSHLLLDLMQAMSSNHGLMNKLRHLLRR